jgi:beta-phosphoglucomutase-like phosphatase (HAD superfamily)
LRRDVLVVENSRSGITTGRATGLTVRGMIGERHHVDNDGEPALPRAGFDVKFDGMTDFHGLAA